MLGDFINSILGKLDYLIVKKSKGYNYPDMEEEFKQIYDKCKEYTMTSIERMYALYKATEYIVKHNIPGDIVECGVWKGGSIMLIAHILLKMKDTSRRIYLYDTYEGMSKPTDRDVSFLNESARKIIKEAFLKNDLYELCYASLDEVKNNVFSTGYPKQSLMFIKGKVEETIPKTIPGKISILRLDTDWYESTLHELIYLFPRLSLNGVIIIDDYGHWKGAREAVERYFEENRIKILLNRIDYAGRIGVKT